VLSQNVFTDPGHLQFRNNAKIVRSSSSVLVNLENDIYDNPVERNENDGFFYYDPNGDFEEWALSSLLWDNYEYS
jgi:hypothetical protein